MRYILLQQLGNEPETIRDQSDSLSALIQLAHYELERLPGQPLHFRIADAIIEVTPAGSNGKRRHNTELNRITRAAIDATDKAVGRG